MSNLHLKEKPSLSDFQKYIEEMEAERGFSNTPIATIFMLLSEEVGELAKAARKQGNFTVDPNSKEYDVAEEAADVFIFLLRICNEYSVDLEQAFRDKEEKNKKRTWK